MRPKWQSPEGPQSWQSSWRWAVRGGVPAAVLPLLSRADLHVGEGWKAEEAGMDAGRNLQYQARQTQPDNCKLVRDPDFRKSPKKTSRGRIVKM